jgi:hypothetical protein
MTEGRDGERAATARRPGALALTWAAAALFLAVLALLAVQVAAGRDPALRARAHAAPLPARRVLVRRIYERKIVVHLPATAPPQASRASQSVSASGSYGSGAPVTRTS